MTDERFREPAVAEIRRHTEHIRAGGAGCEECEALMIEAGERDQAEMDGYPFPDEGKGEHCTCPADLRSRGGFTSRCPVHGA